MVTLLSMGFGPYSVKALLSYFSVMDYHYVEHAPLVLGDVVMELVTF